MHSACDHCDIIILFVHHCGRSLRLVYNIITHSTVDMRVKHIQWFKYTNII